MYTAIPTASGNHIIVPMVCSAQQQILDKKIVAPDVFERGCADIAGCDLSDEGTFFYTWCKAVARC